MLRVFTNSNTILHFMEYMCTKNNFHLPFSNYLIYSVSFTPNWTSFFFKNKTQLILFNTHDFSNTFLLYLTHLIGLFIPNHLSACLSSKLVIDCLFVSHAIRFLSFALSLCYFFFSSLSIFLPHFLVIPLFCSVEFNPVRGTVVSSPPPCRLC